VTDVDLNARPAADPLSTTAGELHGAARVQLPIIGSDHAARLAAATPVPFGVDLYENNAWFEDSTVSFIILKAFEPGYGQDSKFASRFPLAKQTGRKRGAYLFGHPSDSASLAASTFCKILKNNGFQLTDRAWLDHEVTDGKSPSYCSSWAQEVCAAIDDEMGGPVTGVYTYTDFIRQGNCAGLGKYPLWFAYPETAGQVPAVNMGPWTKPVIVQYAVTSIDWDFFLGDSAALAAFWSSAVPAPPAPPPPVKETDMVIVAVSRTGLPPGVAWPGDFLLLGGGTAPVLYHIPDAAAYSGYVAAGIPVKSLTYAQYKAIGGK
jgi:Glycosyl hydrolases family 25